MKLSPLNRILLFATGFLAAYQIAIGIDRMDGVSIVAYTIAFGVLLVACLLLVILGLEVLELPIVVIISTIIPLALSLGLVWQHVETFRATYAAFAVIGFIAVIATRSVEIKNKIPVIVIAVTHGISGMIIFLLPIIIAIHGKTNPLFSLVGIGGALIGIDGLLLSFLKTGKPILSKETILKILPGLLLLMTIFFVLGFKYG